MIVTIEAKAPWWKFDVAEIWAYRHLVMLFATRSLATMYKQSVLGPVWFMVQPFLSAFVFYVVFGLLIRLSTGGMPHMLFYMSGMIFWHLFVNVFQQTSVSLAGNMHLHGKVYFPRLVMPFSYIVSGGVLFGLNLVALLCFYAYYRLQGVAIAFQPCVVLVPLLVLQTVLAGLGFGLCIASATVRFRDLKYALPTLIQFWMFMTPVFYSSTRVSPAMRHYMWINPLFAPVEFFRFTISGINPVPPAAFLPGALLTAGVLTVGLFWFNRAQRDFIDVV